MNLVRLALPLIAAAAIVAGCGDDSDSGDESSAASVAELAAFAPSEAPAITYVNFVDARSELGLPGDADATSFDALKDEDLENPTPEAQLVEAAVLAMPPLTSFVVTFDKDPAAEVFDGGAITAAANTIGGGFPMTILETDQPFSEISKGLTALGYTADGSTLTKEGERFEQVADAGNGIVVIGNNGEAADAVANAGDGPPALIDLLEPADQPIEAAGTGVPDDCITALGGWENAQLTEGTLRFVVDGGASADGFDLDQLGESLRITPEEPTVDGDTVDIDFTAEEGGPATSRVRVMLTRLDSGYDCG